MSSKTDDANDGAEDDHNDDVDNNPENDCDAAHEENKEDLLLWRLFFLWSLSSPFLKNYQLFQQKHLLLLRMISFHF